MKRLVQLAMALAFVGAACLTMGDVSAGAANADVIDAASTEFVCPPCGSDCDDVVHAEAGSCPMCGMALVTRAAASSLTNQRKRAAILVFEGVQIIDFTGPYEVLGQARFDVFTVAKTTEPITTAMGLKVTPSHSFQDAPRADVLVIPGGNVHDAEGDAETIAWLQKNAELAEYTMSVCNGAFILAKAGLLNGRSATTFYGLIDELREAAPTTTVVTDQRFVDNGRVMTTAGLSSGIDGTLHLIEKMYGRGRAREIALHIEYDWQPESGFARATLADMHMPRLRNEAITQARTLSSEGDREHWEKSVALESELSLDDLASLVDEACKDSGWQLASATATGLGLPRETRSAWEFVDRDGKRWKGSVTVSSPEDGVGHYLLKVVLSRTG